MLITAGRYLDTSIRCPGIIFATVLVLVQTVRADVVHVDNGRLLDLVAQGVPVIDVRTEAEWRETGVIDGRYLITFFDEKGHYDVSTWLTRLSDIAEPDEPVILICRTGRRSNLISQFLDKNTEYGRGSIFDAKHGILRWIDANGVTVPP